MPRAELWIRKLKATDYNAKAPGDASISTDRNTDEFEIAQDCVENASRLRKEADIAKELGDVGQLLKLGNEAYGFKQLFEKPPCPESNEREINRNRMRAERGKGLSLELYNVSFKIRKRKTLKPSDGARKSAVGDSEIHTKLGENLVRLKSCESSEDEASTEIFQDLNCTFERNKTTAIIGDTGSGKSTLLKIIAGAYAPSSGQVLIGNSLLTDLNDLPNKEKAEHIVFMPQDDSKQIFAGSVLDNIVYGTEKGKHSDMYALMVQKKVLKHLERDLVEAAELADAAEFIDKLGKDKYLTVIKNPGSSEVQLSGGQRQRLVLARMFFKARNAGVILLDEATSALDNKTQKKVQSNFDRFIGRVDSEGNKTPGKQRKTVIVAAHRLQTIKNADRIIFLKKGKIMCDGTWSKLKEDCEDFRRYLEAGSMGNNTA